MDYDALAKQYGGSVDDLDALAEKFGATKEAPNPLSRTERFTTGLADPFQGGAQLLTKVLPDSVVSAGNRFNNWLADTTGLVARLPEGGVDQQTREREAQYQARRGDQGMDWWRLAGNVVSPANLAVSAAAPARVASLGGRVVAGAGAGGAAGALAPVTEDGDFTRQKLTQIGLSGATGGAVPVVAAGAGRVISPKASTNPDVALLRNEGVKDMTVGQALGGRLNAAEEKLSSYPILGDMIARARQRSLEQFNEAAIRRTTSPIGEVVEGAGQDSVRKAGDVLSKAYDDVLGQIKSVRFDGTFQNEVRSLSRMAQSLTPDMRRKFNKVLSDELRGRTSPANGITSEAFKKADEAIGQQAARYRGSSVASESELGDALLELQSTLRRQLARSNPQYAQRLAQIDEGWANLVRVEGAAKAGKNADGVFTPAQLNQAVQTADRSTRKRSVARGTALMQDLSSAGQTVLGNKVPNSGTADRALLGAGALSAGGYLIDPMIGLGLGAGALAYTSPVQRLLLGSVASRPQAAQPIAGLLNRTSPMLGPTSGLLALDVLE